MSDIRYNQWLHNSGTGGVSQDAGGNIGIGTTAPLIPVGAGNTTILNVGVVTANYIYGTVQGAIEGTLDDWLVHAGDTDTKLGFPAADQIQFDTGGTNYLKLHRYSSVNFVEAGANAHISLADNGNNIRGILIGDGNASSTGGLRLQAGGGSTGFGGGIVMYSHNNGTNAGGVYIGKSLNSGGSIIFGNGGTGPNNEYLRINSTGFVGIGTADPGSPLEVSGGTALDTATFNTHHANGVLINLQRSGTSKGFLGSGKNIADATGGVDDIGLRSNANLILTAGGGTERVRITSDGKVGIGTAVPTGTLEICATSEYQLILKDINNAGQGAEMAIGFKDSANTIQGWAGFNKWEDDDFHTANANSGGHLCFHTHNGTSVAQRMVLKSDGKVGMQIADPKSNLHVYGPGEIRLGGNNGGHASIMEQVEYSSGYTGVHWMFETNQQMSWSFDGVMIVHGSGGSSYGTEVTHIKIVYSRESGALNSGDTWRNGSSDYNIETLGHAQVGLNPSAGSFSYSEQTNPDGAGSTRSLLKLSWSASGQGVGVWSKLIGNFYWGAASSGSSVEIQDKDGNIKFNSNP